MTNQFTNNQDLYKKREALYLLQNELATATEDKRAALLEKKKKLEAELVDALKKNNPTRTYCSDNKCTDMKNLTNKHVKHLPDSKEL